MEKKKKEIIFISSGLFVLFAIIFLSLYLNDTKIKQSSDGQFVTREPVTGKYIVPEVNSENVPEGVARPFKVLPTIPAKNAKITRFFNISIENDEFYQKTIIINDWDAVLIYVKAIDKDYDFIQPNLNISRKIPKGEAILIKNSFGEEGGIRLYFYCPTCGGPEKGPVGEIIVVPKRKIEGRNKK